MKHHWIWCVFAAWALIPGCSSVNDFADEIYLGSRNSYLAESAWKSMRHVYANMPYHKHFRRGFIAGYSDIANCGSGCPPLMPPREYWTVCYQNPEGQAKVQAWFEGFHYGVVVAEQDGVNAWCHVQTTVDKKNCCGSDVEEVPYGPEDGAPANSDGSTETPTTPPLSLSTKSDMDLVPVHGQSDPGAVQP